MQKRDATEEETLTTLKSNCESWNLNNPSFEISLEDWKDKQAVAAKEGYKSEVCDCGCVMLAFHHWTTCREKECPFSDGVSMLERLQQSIEGKE